MHALLLLPMRSRFSTGPPLLPWSSPDNLHAPTSSYSHQSTRPPEILVAPSHEMGQESEGKGCKRERWQRRGAPKPACQGRQGEPSTTSKSVSTSVQSPPVLAINFHSSQKRFCPQGGPWQNNSPRKAPGQREGPLQWVETWDAGRDLQSLWCKTIFFSKIKGQLLPYDPKEIQNKLHKRSLPALPAPQGLEQVLIFPWFTAIYWHEPGSPMCRLLTGNTADDINQTFIFLLIRLK